MSVRDELGNRMKTFYEVIPKARLMRRTPVAIRLDGKSFHTFTRGFKKPFDEVFMGSMLETMKYLCENIQGCVFGYSQSDEITLILIDYQNFNSSAWFDYEVQKMCSVAASMATMAFNKFFMKRISELCAKILSLNFSKNDTEVDAEILEPLEIYRSAFQKGAMFDARCFNIPKEEVANLCYWRQLDAIRNSVQMVGQANFSQKELQNKSCSMIKEMLLEEKNIDWNSYSPSCKYGTACRKVSNYWEIDYNTPIFKEDWNYINSCIYVGES